MAAQSNDSSYPSCLSYNCANITISYPFWRIHGETPTQYCGYEGFGINCSNYGGGPEIPIAYLGNDSYYAHNISYESKSIILVDYDVAPVVPVDDCPRVRHNIDLGDLLFNFWGQNVNLSFHFNCTGVPSFSHEIQCLSNPSNKSCVHSLNDEPENFNWTEYSCDEEVVTTVMDVFSTTTALETQFRGALMQGFELKWGRTEYCEICEWSGGRCGHNSITREDMCFCSAGKTATGYCIGYILSFKSAFNLLLLSLPWRHSHTLCFQFRRRSLSELDLWSQNLLQQRLRSVRIEKKGTSDCYYRLFSATDGGGVSSPMVVMIEPIAVAGVINRKSERAKERDGESIFGINTSYSFND
ncbi:hypothetical protein L2E82_10242 [Cichorium intybus]|uniref:Uncharacterized protein n=1 Tax=Cichorium intybus TaxID=13427 RepID=A0ACB9G9U8_CICIN|nr:hypothetical protein L2E82_10242 [Cichorium intybus]